MKYKISAICTFELIEDTKDFNVDVYIIFENDTWYCPTFFTLDNIRNIMNYHKISGESASGTYLWSSDMVIVKEITKEVIQITVEDLIQDGIESFGFHKGYDNGRYNDQSPFDFFYSN